MEVGPSVEVGKLLGLCVGSCAVATLTPNGLKMLSLLLDSNTSGSLREFREVLNGGTSLITLFCTPSCVFCPSANILLLLFPS